MPNEGVAADGAEAAPLLKARSLGFNRGYGTLIQRADYAVVLGAGFSKCAGLPLTSELSLSLVADVVMTTANGTPAANAAECRADHTKMPGSNRT